VIAVAVVVALVGGGILVAAFGLGGKSTTSATGTPSASPSSSPTPTASPGTKTGTVQPSPGPTAVACGGTTPPTATKPKPQFAGPPPMTIDPKKTYTATMKTSCGTIVVTLLASQAPKTVNSFVFLADKGYFDGTRIHRIDTSIDIIQGGDPLGNGTGGPGYSIPDELTGKESYGPGVVAMANAGPNTGGSQFFIVYGPKGHGLDSAPNYTIFGQVTKGLDVVKKIAALPVQNPAAGLSGQQPKQAVYIDSVTISSG
jgi:cyclophilin family peptidyl-prolyl cis-trans isomerase